MSSLVIYDSFGMTEKNGIPLVSSRKVALDFGKRHDNVLQSISSLKCSERFRLLNFQESSYKNEQNKKQPECLMTRDGFSILVMGFTGEKAMQFKEAYIDAFNKMEQFIKDLFEAKADFPEFTDAIIAAHEEPKFYHFATELDMINKIVLGMNAKQFKEVKGLDSSVKSIRPYLTPNELQGIKSLQRMDIGLILNTPDFQQRKQILTNQFYRIKSKLLSA